MYILKDIEKAVSETFNISIAALRSPQRHRKVARPRQLVMYLARELTTASYPQIGRHLGGRNHTTIMHGRKKIERMLRETNAMACHLDDVRATLATIVPHKAKIAASVAEGLGRQDRCQ